MKKTLFAAICMHLLVFSFVWIGFPVAQVKDNVSFYYGQILVPSSTDVLSVENKVPVKAETMSDQHVWNKIRIVNKPKR